MTTEFMGFSRSYCCTQCDRHDTVVCPSAVCDKAYCG